MTGEGYRQKRGLNTHGVKNGADLWRTFAGIRYSWLRDGTAEDAAAYRTHGVRCRCAAANLYVHPDDHDRAMTITLKELRG